MERLYLQDPYRTTFQARVTGICTYEGNPAVKLDRSCFYPASGGQPADRGSIDGSRVASVEQDGDEVIHVLTESGLQIGDTVRGEIDWKRRFDHMQQHTGQHILSQAFLKTVGASTESFHLGAGLSTIDLNLEELSAKSIYQAEDDANGIVFQKRPIRIHWIDSSDQGKLPIRSPSKRRGKIRIVEVDAYDFSPCGGTHCSLSAEVGLIKVLRWVRVNRQVRVEFVCGWRALEDYRRKNREVYQLCKLTSRHESELSEGIKKLKESERSSRKESARLNNRLLDFEIERLLAQGRSTGGITLVAGMISSKDSSILQRAVGKILAKTTRCIVLLGTGGPKPGLVFGRSEVLGEFDMRSLILSVAPLFDGRGGGTPDRAQAGGQLSDGIAGALERAVQLIEAQLAGEGTPG